MDPMQELRATFLEECDELLSGLEGRLNALRDGSQAVEDINAAFRAIHSVKGGAGAFGMPALVELAHVFEAALDHLRGGRIAPSDAPHALFLQALDQVALLVASAREGSDARAPADIISALQRVGTQQHADAPASGTKVPVDGAPVSKGPVTIVLRPHVDLFRRAVDVRDVFASLELLGALRVRTLTDRLPTLAELDAQDCHLGFDLEVATDAPEAHIADVLELHLDAAEFVIGNKKPDHAEPQIAVAVAAPEPAPINPPPATAGTVPSAPVIAPKPKVDAVSPPAPPARATNGSALALRSQSLSSIRVDLQRIDRLMNLVGEIVITQSMLDQRLLSLPSAATAHIADGLQQLARQTRELQDSVMAVRAQPVKNVFQRMPRMVRELGQTLGKQVRLQILGEDTEVDKTIIEELADPLTHMIRNAMDHGLETPEERAAAGKPAEGVVTLQAEQRGGRIVISVADDGRGINRERLLAKARSRNLVPAGERPSPEEIDQLLFHPGLSTAEAITDVSGRGVGMDVVKQNVEALGGRVLVSSELGFGTRFTMLLPLTLAVMDGMIIRLGRQRLVLPIASIRETLQASETPVETLPGGHEFLRLRDTLSPLVRLGKALGLGPGGGEQVIVMTETDRGNQIGLSVDEIIGQQQVVVKSLEASYGTVPGASAATILGDGLVALIVDVDAIPAICAPAMAAMRASTSSIPRH
jgi:two-component system, chemotaxis family, sensor kinase CheA